MKEEICGPLLLLSPVRACTSLKASDFPPMSSQKPKISRAILANEAKIFLGPPSTWTEMPLENISTVVLLAAKKV